MKWIVLRKGAFSLQTKEEKNWKKRSPGRPKHSEKAGRLDTESLILYHAGLLFLKSGYAAVSINMITKAAGVTKPTLYHYFQDKEHLYAAVLRHILKKVGEEIRLRAKSEKKIEEKLIDLVYGYFKYSAMSLHTLFRDVTEQLNHDLAEQVHQAIEEQIVLPHKELFQDAMRRGEIRNEPDQIAVYTDIWLGMLEALMIRIQKKKSDEEIMTITQRVVSVFMNGVGNRN